MVALTLIALLTLVRPSSRPESPALSGIVLADHPAFTHVIDPTPQPSLIVTAPPPTRALAAAPKAAVAAPPRPAMGPAQMALINGDRASAGLPPLAWSSCLAAVAAANAARMAAQGYISHANGPQLDLACGLGMRAGENVGFTSTGINDSLLNSLFLNSPEHRANILGAYRYVATAWAVAPNGSGYIAVEFG